MIVSAKNEIELNKMLTVDEERITDRYWIIYTTGNYEFFDKSLNEVVFTGTKKEMEIFIQGFVCGRTTQG